MPAPSFSRAPSTSSAVGLVIANLVPLVGVIWFGWDLFGIMWLYWAENAVIGVFGILRIVTAGEIHHWSTIAGRTFLGGFFALHYGFFWFVHGVFVYALFSGGRELDGAGMAALEGVPLEGLIPLVLSHGASFVLNYLRGGESRLTSGPEEMAKPYGRVVVLHIVIIAGGLLLLAAGGAIWTLMLFIVLKTAVDLGIHLKGHQMRLAKASGGRAESGNDEDETAPLAPEARPS